MQQNKRYILFIFYLIFLSFFLTTFCWAQYPEIFTKKEKKNIEKAEKLDEKAREYDEKANELYVEMYSLQEEGETNEKKLAGIEEKTLKNQIKAAEYYEEAIVIKYEVYKQKLTDLKESQSGNQSSTTINLLEEQAEEYYYRSRNLRTEASMVKDLKTQYARLSEAREYEKMAFDKLEQALAKRTNTSIDNNPIEEEISPRYTNTATSNNGNPASGIPDSREPQINKNLVEKYQVYLDEGDLVYSEGSVDSLNDLSGFDVETLRKAWYSHAYDVELDKMPQMPDTMELAEVTDDMQFTNDNTELDSQPVSTSEANSSALTHSLEESDAKSENVIPSSKSEVGGKKYIYRVQIAADKANLSQGTLQKIYSGNKRVQVLNEDGWNKYSVGDFESYEKAEEFKRTGGIENGFIVAFEIGDRLKLKEVSPGTVTKTSVSAKAEPVLSDEIIFQVQIAASKTPMNEFRLKSMYKGDNQIRVFQEDGWYKYAVGQTSNYKEAVSARNNAGIPGAFITAYKNGKKLNLYHAIKGRTIYADDVPSARKHYSKYNGTYYAVQIAASRSPIDPSQLKRIYPGSRALITVTEDGWYKYRIDVGQSLEVAKNIKKETGVKGAFVVAYDDGRKISIKESIKHK